MQDTPCTYRVSVKALIKDDEDRLLLIRIIQLLWLGMRDSTRFQRARKFTIASAAGIGTFPCDPPQAALTPIMSRIGR